MKKSASKTRAGDQVNHPPHYTQHPSGVECIQITEHYGFCIGSAIKYLWRAGLKGDAVQDLKKAVWYINREITNRQRSTTPAGTKPDYDQVMTALIELRRWVGDGDCSDDAGCVAFQSTAYREAIAQADRAISGGKK
jgi:hypothetical protein